MVSRFRGPSPATFIALLALFVSLGGTSYAAITITGKNVKNSSLTGKDIKNSSLASKDIKNRSLLKKDFKSGQLPRGATGPQGVPGVPGVQSISQVESAAVSVGPGQVGSARADCPSGSAPSGTGFDASIGNVAFAQRFGQFVGVAVYNDTSITIQIEAQAVCARGAGVAVASSRTKRAQENKFAQAVANSKSSVR